jgi:hypothetical protein
MDNRLWEKLGGIHKFLGGQTLKKILPPGVEGVKG